eukprot:gene8213-9093_t
MSEHPAITQFRNICLKRGASGIKGLGRQFKIMDDDRSKSLTYEEFRKGTHDFGLVISEDETKAIFAAFDSDGMGTISFDEFIGKLRPPMSKTRQDLIAKAFKSADKTGDGILDAKDMKRVYNARKHPKYLNGEWTEGQVFNEFLKTFEPDEASRDGRVTLDEFTNYYAGVSNSIDDDAYFDLMMRNAWKI